MVLASLAQDLPDRPTIASDTMPKPPKGKPESRTKPSKPKTPPEVPPTTGKALPVTVAKAMARHAEQVLARDAKLLADPDIQAGIKQSQKFEAARLAASAAALPFKTAFDNLVAANPNGCESGSETSKQFAALRFAIEDATMRTFTQHGFTLSQSTTQSNDNPEEGRLWFDEQGHLNQSGPVPLSRYLGELSNQLQLFLMRLDSCERNNAGDYLLRDSRAGTLSGMRVLWDNVVLLCQTSVVRTLPDLTLEQNEARKRGSVLVIETGPTRNMQPLADALRQLLFSILYKADGSWVSEIPSATVGKIRTIGAELPQHRAACEQSEGVEGLNPHNLDDTKRSDAAQLRNTAIHTLSNRNYDTDYRPASAFKKGMAPRLRQAASRNRKSKRVKTRQIDGVVCYSVADVRQWWPSEAPKET